MTNPIPSAVLARLKDKSPATRIAVVGASNDPGKYGFIITKTLAAHGYSVFPVNPKGGMLAGIPGYTEFASVPGPIHVVDLVTPPAVTRRILEHLDPATVEAVWLQDGSFDDDVLRVAAARFPVVVHHACIMEASRGV